VNYQHTLDQHISYDGQTKMFQANYGGMIAYATTKEKARVLVEALIKTYAVRMRE